jgi:hypothetical protein
MSIRPALPQSRHLPVRRELLTRQQRGHFNRWPSKSVDCRNGFKFTHFGEKKPLVKQTSPYKFSCPVKPEKLLSPLRGLNCIKPMVAKVERQNKSLFSRFGRWNAIVLRLLCHRFAP